MKKLFAVLVLAALVGCVSPEAPRTAKESLVYATQTHDGLVKSTGTALDLKAITPAEGRECYTVLAQVKIGLDATRVAFAGCKDANGQKVDQVPGLTAAPAIVPGAVPTAIIQAVSCNPISTPIDQLALANSLLTRLSIYYTSKGVQ